jgi:predicted polyphosphate/ATP-dependent NAD kinase
VWKTQNYMKRHWPTLQVPLLGIAIGMTLFLGVQLLSPHPGQSCSRLGQIAEEMQLGGSSRMLICSATLDGDFRYNRAIMPEKKVASALR